MKKIKERPDEVKRLIKAGINFNRYFRQDREGAIQAMIEWIKIDRETATATYDSALKAFNDDGGLPEDGLRLLIDEAKEANEGEPRRIAPGDVADLSMLRDAQKELGK